MSDPKPYRAPGFRSFLAVMGASLVLGLVMGLGSIFLQDTVLGDAGAALIVATGGLFGIIAIVVLWWRRVDEAAREAHKWAWWWGGSPGMAAGGIGVMALINGEWADARLAGFEPDTLVGLSVVAVLGVQIVGYTLAWLWWWAVRR